jgi:uncharacterized protein (DUF1501 family)
MRAHCPGPTDRRTVLRAGLGLAGLGLPGAFGEAQARAPAPEPTPDTSVILFWMWGGPSQFETFDPKPEAPAEVRGPFRPIRTAVPGFDVCELFPQLARAADKLAVVRSLHHTMSSHNDGSIEVLTGKTPTTADPTSTAKSDHPDLGMVASKWRGLRPDGLPQYVGIPTKPFMTRPNYLGLSHQGFAAGNPSAANYAPPALALSGGVKPEQFADRRTLLADFDRLRRDIDRDGALEGTDQLRTAALRMLTNPAMARAFDVAREEAKLRDRYGRHLWGQSCLLARRLTEAGAAVVVIDALAPEPGKPLYFSWDDHANAQPGWDMAKGMRLRAADMDPALTTLIEDIHERGLQKKIAVVAIGEFGRTPRLTSANGCIGRDHWPQAQSALVAGGGWSAGQVIGATTSKAEYPTERPLTPQDLLATIYRHLGIEPHSIAFRDFAGRPIPILQEGAAIPELTA